MEGEGHRWGDAAGKVRETYSGMSCEALFLVSRSSLM